jgi:integrase
MKSKKGAGSFTKLPNGTFEFTISVGYDECGKRKRKKFYGKTETECRKHYNEFIRNGETAEIPRNHTLSAWLDQWLTTYKQHKVEGSTYEDYCNLAAHTKRHRIGDMKLTTVKPIHITEFFTDIIDYSRSFRKRMKFLLNAAFETAIDNDFCERNPVRRAEIASKQQPEKESYTESEASAIADFAKSDDLFGTAMYIMLNSGVRAGEMRAMQVSSIDFASGILHINQAVKRTGELGLPKNNKTRQIPLEDDALAFLRLRLQGKSGYIIGGDRYVTHSGFRGRYEWFFDRLNRHLENQGKPRIEMKSPHSTRHTFSTLRQKHGMPVAMVAALLGHATLEMTGKYTHLGDIETLSEAVRKYPLKNLLA